MLNDAGQPVTFESQAALNSPDQTALHTYGQSFSTRWVTIHDTATDGSAPFESDALAKAAHGTPFKRPENGLFRPGVGFRLQGRRAHAGMDNVAWLSHDLVTFVEDAGDGLHAQRNALDSGFVFNARSDYSNPANQPVRWLAEGRDPSATIDSANGGFDKNEGDNEITGAHVSDGDPTTAGILGARDPKLGNGRWTLVLHPAAR